MFEEAAEETWIDRRDSVIRVKRDLSDLSLAHRLAFQRQEHPNGRRLKSRLKG
jgi:hypothetical protein